MRRKTDQPEAQARDAGPAPRLRFGLVGFCQILASASRAAAMVESMCSSVCAAELSNEAKNRPARSASEGWDRRPSLALRAGRILSTLGERLAGRGDGLVDLLLGVR